MTASNPPSVVLLAKTDGPEFAAARSLLTAACRLTQAQEVASLASALACGEICPELIVVAQSRPGEFTLPEVEALRRAAPLARVIALLGAWCEGEVRSGTPWPGVPRLYWHQSVPRLQRELALLHKRQLSSWSLPITASEEERLLIGSEQPRANRQGRVAVAGENPQVVELLATACRRRGYAVIAADLNTPSALTDLTLALYEASRADPVSVDRLAALAAKVRPAPTIALLGFPRRHDLAAALDAGAVAVVSKPLLLDDLFVEMDRVQCGPSVR